MDHIEDIQVSTLLATLEEDLAKVRQECDEAISHLKAITEFPRIENPIGAAREFLRRMGK